MQTLYKLFVCLWRVPCRDQEVLSVFAAIIRRLKQSMEAEVPKVLAAVFEPTLQVRIQLLCTWRMPPVVHLLPNIASLPVVTGVIRCYGIAQTRRFLQLCLVHVA